VAPTGEVTVNEVADADETTALVAPKYTILLAAVVLKFVPVMVTVVPGLAILGLTDVMAGGCSMVNALVAVTAQPVDVSVTV
jgi:hypothetical protein